MPLSFHCQVGGLPSLMSPIFIPLFSHSGWLALLSACPASPGIEASDFPRLTPLFVEGWSLTTACLLSSCSAEQGRPAAGTELRGCVLLHNQAFRVERQKETWYTCVCSNNPGVHIQRLRGARVLWKFQDHFYNTTGFGLPSQSREECRGKGLAPCLAQEKEDTLWVGLTSWG